jgi:asparagine synthase (glutamine-hydrolysing)
MCAAIVHRGPDDEGFYLSPRAGLGMRRLRIIDLETGRQPVRNEDGTVWAVFNGEIYNYQDLRRDLIARGHTFRTSTDTEVIVHLYEERGERCVEDLRGMFAFAVWDERRRSLLLARDRLGIKPLYYAEVGGRLLFASELKAILQLPEVERRLNWRAVSHVFSFLSTPATESIVDGVKKLEPGHTLTAAAGQAARLSRYWDLQIEPRPGRTEDEVVEGLREVLEESVRLHLVSDVPLGAFLSGGIDSSSVVATMAPLVSSPVKTFSIGFPEEGYNELGHARRAAQWLGTDHHELVLEPDVVGILEDLAWHLDEPFGDSSAIPTYMVSKLASEHVKVVLSGDGGDEIFAGYDRYVVDDRRRHLGMLRALGLAPAIGALSRALPDGTRGKRYLADAALPRMARYLAGVSHFDAPALAALVDGDAAAAVARAGDVFAPHVAHGAGLRYPARLQALDIATYLPGDILTKVDRMSMAHSLEARVPLLDHTLVEFAARLPARLALRGGTGKSLFKQALAGLVPDAILARPKKGFSVPLTYWFRDGLAEFLGDHLLGPHALGHGWLRRAAVEQLFADFRRTGRSSYLGQLWTLLVLELWYRGLTERATR